MFDGSGKASLIDDKIPINEKINGICHIGSYDMSRSTSFCGNRIQIDIARGLSKFKEEKQMFPVQNHVEAGKVSDEGGHSNLFSYPAFDEPVHSCMRMKVPLPDVQRYRYIMFDETAHKYLGAIISMNCIPIRVFDEQTKFVRFADMFFHSGVHYTSLRLSDFLEQPLSLDVTLARSSQMQNGRYPLRSLQTLYNPITPPHYLGAIFS
jgi:hypothetical protein